MPHQLEITIQASLRPDSAERLEGLLADARSQRFAGSVLPMSGLRGVHFARVIMLPAAKDLDGDVIPACVMLMCDIDAPLGARLRDLTALPGFDDVFRCCADYPQRPDRRNRLAWVHAHLTPTTAAYVHRIGRSCEQVVAEQRLRDELEDILDGPVVRQGDQSPSAVHQRIRAEVASRSDLSWACEPPRPPGLIYRLRNLVDLVAVPLVVLLLLPLLIPAALIGILLIRRLERSDVAETGAPDLARVAEIEQFEDFGAQNPFTAVGLVKAGIVRRLTLKVILRGLAYTNRHFYARDNLAGVHSIHFARWVSLDGGRRLMFASSYDGSQESYMDDFIDQLAWGLNAVFSNGLGFPTTRWLILDGSKDETAFKHYLRRHQIPTGAFYSAYPDAPGRDVDTCSSIRDGLTRTLDDREAAQWLALL